MRKCGSLRFIFAHPPDFFFLCTRAHHTLDRYLDLLISCEENEFENQRQKVGAASRQCIVKEQEVPMYLLRENASF